MQWSFQAEADKQKWTEKVRPPPSFFKSVNDQWMCAHRSDTHIQSRLLMTPLVFPSTHWPNYLNQIRIRPLNSQSPFWFFFMVIQHTGEMSSLCYPTQCHRNMPRPCNTTQIPLLWYPAPTISQEVFFLSFAFWFPKVCQDQQIPQTSVPCQPPIQHPLLSPLSHPCLLVHMQRKEASPLWQQQNTTLQKRCAPLTVTIKKGVDRIRAGDDDLRGRDVQKEARREKKGLSLLCLLFFLHTFFFIFPGFIKPHLTHVWLGWRLSPQRVGSPFLHCMPLLHGALSFSRQFTFQNRRRADQTRSLTMRPFISGSRGMQR